MEGGTSEPKLVISKCGPMSCMRYRIIESVNRNPSKRAHTRAANGILATVIFNLEDIKGLGHKYFYQGL